MRLPPSPPGAQGNLSKRARAGAGYLSESRPRPPESNDFSYFRSISSIL
jgi:hypothetical protein